MFSIGRLVKGTVLSLHWFIYFGGVIENVCKSVLHPCLKLCSYQCLLCQTDWDVCLMWLRAGFWQQVDFFAGWEGWWRDWWGGWLVSHACWAMCQFEVCYNLPQCPTPKSVIPMCLKVLRTLSQEAKKKSTKLCLVLSLPWACHSVSN